MKPRILISTAVTCLCLLALPWKVSTEGFLMEESVCHALSALKEVRVLSEVSTTKKHVSLLDLCDLATLPGDWKEAMARVDVGDAPLPGSEKYIDSQQMKAYLERFVDSKGSSASQVSFDVPDRITVTRQANQIGKEKIEEIFTKFVKDNTPWNPQDVVIQKVVFSGLPVIPAGEMTYEVVPASRERLVGSVGATINFSVDGEKVYSLNVNGKVEVYQNVVLAAHPLKQNDTVTAADIELQRVDISDGPDRYLTQADQVVNRRVVRGIGVHQAIGSKDLDKPLALKRGDAVTIVYDQPGLHLTAKGLAREDAGVGDSVKVANAGSNKIVFCRVIDSQTVQASR